MEQKDFIKLAKEKSLYKYRGKVIEVIKVTTGVVNCILFKTSKINGKSEKLITCFTCYGTVGEYFLANYKKNDRLKIKFRIKSVAHNGRYITNLIAVEHELWRLNDDKLSKAERIEKINESMAQTKQTGMKFNENEWT